MALTLATELANYAAGIGTQGATLKIDSANKRVGVGTTNPQGPEGSLQVGTGITFFGNTGIISAIGGKFSGDFTVGGTLTYEDVQNVNSSGVGTFSGGINIVGGGLTVTGVSTFFSRVSIADSIVHTGDIDTSLRFPAADTFSVETGGSEVFRADSSQRLLVNKTTSTTSNGHSILQVASTSNDRAIAIHNFENDANGPFISLGKSRGTSVNSYTIVQDNDELGNIDFFGADGTDFSTIGARIQAEVDGTPGTNDLPGRLIFATTADGANSPTERLRLDSSGQVLINGGNDARSNFHGGGTTYRFQVESTSFETSAPAFICNSNTAGHGPHVTLARSRGTSVGSNTIVQDDDVVGVINFQGNDGTHFENVARIRAEIDGTPGADDMPGRLTFFTVADGSVSPTERLRITSNGEVRVPDGGKFSCGTGDDLMINHDGGNSFIDNFTGTFVLRNYADDSDILLSSDNSSGGVADYVRCDGSTGAVILSHYGSTKLETSATGVTVTGTLNATTALTQNGNALATNGKAIAMALIFG